MGQIVVITDYVEHMMQESKKCFQGTTHEDDWMIYHDALTLMRAKDCKDWMQSKDYLRRWILPSDDLYKG